MVKYVRCLISLWPASLLSNRVHQYQIPGIIYRPHMHSMYRLNPSKATRYFYFVLFYALLLGGSPWCAINRHMPIKPPSKKPPHSPSLYQTQPTHLEPAYIESLANERIARGTRKRGYRLLPNYARWYHLMPWEYNPVFLFYRTSYAMLSFKGKVGSATKRTGK